MRIHPQAAHALPDERRELPSGAAVMSQGMTSPGYPGAGSRGRVPRGAAGSQATPAHEEDGGDGISGLGVFLLDAGGTFLGMGANSAGLSARATHRRSSGSAPVLGEEGACRVHSANS
jgi:hypothetical protein